MIFSSKNNKHRVKSFVLKVSSGAQNKPVAYGPGSVVNGKKWHNGNSTVLC
jgi:hypothetical protein